MRLARPQLHRSVHNRQQATCVLPPDLRNATWYKNTIWAMRMHVLPILFVLALAWVVLTSSSHILFNVADSTGAFCTGDERAAKPVNLGIDQPGHDFRTNQFCAPTGLKVRRGYRYEIVVEVTQEWSDGADICPCWSARSSTLLSHFAA